MSKHFKPSKHAVNYLLELLHQSPGSRTNTKILEASCGFYLAQENCTKVDRERFHTHPHTITQKHKLSTRKFQKDQDPQNFLAAHFVQCIGTGSQARITSSSLRRSKRRCQCPPLDRCPSRKKCCLSDSCNPYTARDSEQQSKPSTSERRSC